MNTNHNSHSEQAGFQVQSSFWKNTNRDQLCSGKDCTKAEWSNQENMPDQWRQGLKRRVDKRKIHR